MMVPFIARAIEMAKDNGGTEAGRAKYCAYFAGTIRQKLYGKYEPEVDVILDTDGYGDCIVEF